MVNATSSHTGADTSAHDADRPGARAWPWLERPVATLAKAAVLGTIFGFLLQKGGVAKFDILIGALLLENFVVVKVMLTAIVVGMVGVHVLAQRGLLEPQIGETVYGAVLVGGLLFGVGFGLLAYCPGTDAAAVGQGNLDALVGVVGMVAGSYVYARWSGIREARVVRWGKRGEITLADVVGVRRGVFVAAAAPILVVVLVLLEAFGP